MSYRYEKSTGDIVIEGFENGISPSPHKGLANLQNVNISTETGEVMCSFNRVRQDQVSATGTLVQVNTNTVSITVGTLLPGSMITITNAGSTGLSGTYYYLGNGKLFNGSGVCPNDPDNCTVVTGITSGTATFSVALMGEPFQSAIENYGTGNQTSPGSGKQTRYYILDKNSVLWCHDSATLVNYPTPTWFYVRDMGNSYSGLAIYNGWVVTFRNINNAMTSIWLPTSKLGTGGFTITSLAMSSSTIHQSLVGHQGKLYVTDGNYVASFFANTSLITGAANVQSYCEWSGGTYSTISALISGSFPTLGQVSTIRIPAMFYSTGTMPSSMNYGTIYYIEGSITGFQTFQFQVFANPTGGSSLDTTTGAVGRQFFDTFSPLDTRLFTFTPQRLNLPSFETAQCMAELGNTVVIGCSGNVLYPWDQISPLPADLIPLPENDTHGMITVNNMLYVFAGHKGNVYITNGSSASLATTVPDYCAGIAGTPASYIEPYFSWGGSMYCRGRVYFSILDQTATKTGNCGGVWSFVPTQNFYIGQDTGLALRLENQNSYGTYNGYAPVLINSMVQTAIAPQYWAGWVSDINTPTYGIDFTDTVPCTTAIIETDLIPTGTVINKKTFQQLEYKLASPLANGESISLNYRLNGVDAWASVGTLNVESTTALAGYFDVNFQNTQWIQLQVILNSLGNSSSSFVRLNQVRMR